MMTHRINLRRAILVVLGLTALLFSQARGGADDLAATPLGKQVICLKQRNLTLDSRADGPNFQCEIQNAVLGSRWTIEKIGKRFAVLFTDRDGTPFAFVNNDAIWHISKDIPGRLVVIRGVAVQLNISLDGEIWSAEFSLAEFGDNFVHLELDKMIELLLQSNDVKCDDVNGTMSGTLRETKVSAVLSRAELMKEFPIERLELRNPHHHLSIQSIRIGITSNSPRLLTRVQLPEAMTSRVNSELAPHSVPDEINPQIAKSVPKRSPPVLPVIDIGRDYRSSEDFRQFTMKTLLQFHGDGSQGPGFDAAPERHRGALAFMYYFTDESGRPSGYHDLASALRAQQRDQAVTRETLKNVSDCFQSCIDLARFDLRSRILTNSLIEGEMLLYDRDLSARSIEQLLGPETSKLAYDFLSSIIQDSNAVRSERLRSLALLGQAGIPACANPVEFLNAITKKLTGEPDSDVKLAWRAALAQLRRADESDLEVLTRSLGDASKPFAVRFTCYEGLLCAGAVSRVPTDDVEVMLRELLNPQPFVDSPWPNVYGIYAATCSAQGRDYLFDRLKAGSIDKPEVAMLCLLRMTPRDTPLWGELVGRLQTRALDTRLLTDERVKSAQLGIGTLGTPDVARQFASSALNSTDAKLINCAYDSIMRQGIAVEFTKEMIRDLESSNVLVRNSALSAVAGFAATPPTKEECDDLVRLVTSCALARDPSTRAVGARALLNLRKLGVENSDGYLRTFGRVLNLRLRPLELCSLFPQIRTLTNDEFPYQLPNDKSAFTDSWWKANLKILSDAKAWIAENADKYP